MLEEPREATESIEQAKVSIAIRLLFSFWAVLVVVLPGFAASLGALRVTSVFTNLVNAEEAGSTAIQTGLHLSNKPLIVAFVVSAILAFGMAVALATSQKRRLAGVGLPLSIAIPILAVTPGAFLWFAEKNIVDLLAGMVTDVSIADFVIRVTTSRFLALGSGLLVQGVVVLCAVISLIRSPQARTDPLSLPRVFIWLVSGVLLLMFAGLFSVLV
jgi:hypothetical protein